MTEEQSPDKLSDIVTRLTDQHNNTPHIPVDIFATALSPAESLVKYLKEHKQLRYADIARLLNRDQRSIWCTYNNAKTKNPHPFNPALPATIPASLFSSRKLSILEHLVSHLKQKHTITAIAKLLNKSISTIATVHQRARRKQQ